MSDRFKYSLNGVYRCENFAERARQNNFPRVPIGSAGGYNGWYIILRILEESNPPVLYPFISFDNKPAIVLRYFFNVIKKDGSSCFKSQACFLTAPNFGPAGHDMCIMDLLNEENGYLDDDGGLTVEYGVHVDAISRDDGIWKFNFNDPFFNSENALEIEYGPEDRPANVLYGHKQFLRFHSPLFQNQVTTFKLGLMAKWRIEQCLQIAHGVRIQSVTACMTSWIADCNELRNVVHYIDQKVSMEWNPKDDLSNASVFQSLIELGLRHYLALLINQFECFEDLRNILRQLNIQEMSGEAMKTFTSKIFELKS